MMVQAQIGILAALMSLGLGFTIFLRDRENLQFQLFALLCLCLSIQQVLVAFTVISSAIWGIRLQCLAYAFLIPVLINFFRNFPERIFHQDSRLWLNELWAVFAFLLLAAAPPSIFSKPLMNTSWHVHEALMKGIIWVGLVRACLQLQIQYRHTAHPLRKARLRILLWGSVICLLGLSIEGLFEIPPVGILLCLVFLYFIYLALTYYRLLDLKEFIGHGIVFAFQVTLFTSGLALWLKWTERNIPTEILFSSGVIIAMIVLWAESLRRWLIQIVQHFFFYRQYEFGKNIASLREQLAGLMNADSAIKSVMNALSDSGRVTNASLYLMEKEFLVFRKKTQFGNLEELPEVISNPILLDKFRAQTKPILLEELQNSELPNKQKSEIYSLMEAMESQFILPLTTHQGNLLGFLNVQARGIEEPYSHSEIRLLMTLVGRLATVLENAHIHQKIIENERLLELGEMAAGLAHEIRNPLGAIKGAAQFLATRKNSNKDGKDQRDSDKFLRIIIDETNRLNGVLEQFLDFARSERSDPLPEVQMNSIISHTLEIIAANGLPKNIKIKKDLGRDLAPCRADAEKLKQVFINLIHNSIQAMPRGGLIKVETHMNEAGQVEIRISDSGESFTPKESGRIFLPFFTTKEKGSGLGLSIAQRIIEDHGGEIEAIAKGPLGGAQFSIRLNAVNPEAANLE